MLLKCAERVDKTGRGAMVSLWRQRLSVALQKAGFRIPRLKFAAALGALPEARIEAGGLQELSVADVDYVPGAPLACGLVSENAELARACDAGLQWARG